MGGADRDPAVGDRVYSLDRMAARVQVVRAGDGGGRSVGRRGRGPGELEGPTGVAVFEDAFVVANLGRASFEVFDSVGEYRRSVPAGAMVFALHPLPTGRLLVSAFTGREGRWTIFEADGSAGPTLEWPATVTAKDAVFDGCERVGTAGPHVLRWSCTVPYLQVIDTSGALLREILVDREAEETSREALAAAVEALHLFSASGVYLAELRFERAWVDFDLVGSVLYTLERDPDMDLRSPVARRLELPPPPPS